MSKPYFETVKSFADVPISQEGVETESFLEALDGLVGMFNLFGSKMFSFVQADIRTNIQGVRTKYESAKEACNTLERLVDVDAAQDTTRKAVGCLLRLLRGLSFISKTLKKSQSNPDSPFYVCFRQAYEETLMRHHGFLVRNVVHAALRAVPNRESFYAQIAQGTSREDLEVQMGRWVDGAEGIVQRMKGFLEAGHYGLV